MREHVRLLLADLAAVCVAGRPAPASELAAAYASAVHPGDEATALLDGRRLGAVGAAWCNGVLANVLDYDDGHRITKGHPGAMVIPAALAAAQLADAPPRRSCSRSCGRLRDRDPRGRRASTRATRATTPVGAWGALGAAAAAAGSSASATTAIHHAIGLAEYHAPIALIRGRSRSPPMTKDTTAPGARSSASAPRCWLPAASRRSTRPSCRRTRATSGSVWRLEELYLKAYPCCRWSQPGIHAALEARGGERLEPGRRGGQITTFAAADALAKVLPSSTEETQYNLVWPVANVVATGGFTVADVLGPLGRPRSRRRVMDRTRVVIDPSLTARSRRGA